MNSLLGRTMGAIAVCVGFYFLTRGLLGPAVWLILAVVIGVAFSRIVIDFGAVLSWRLREHHLDPLSGTHFEFQNHIVHVLEDEDHCRWIATDEIRTIVGQLAGDQALAKLFPSGHQRMGKDQKLHLRDDALLAHLSHATTPQAVKFKNWAERNVAFPARRLRKRAGVTLSDPSKSADD